MRSSTCACPTGRWQEERGHERAKRARAPRPGRGPRDLASELEQRLDLVVHLAHARDFARIRAAMQLAVGRLEAAIVGLGHLFLRDLQPPMDPLQRVDEDGDRHRRVDCREEGEAGGIGDSVNTKFVR